jgi:hypothetical protein
MGKAADGQAEGDHLSRGTQDRRDHEETEDQAINLNPLTNEFETAAQQKQGFLKQIETGTPGFLFY